MGLTFLENFVNSHLVFKRLDSKIYYIVHLLKKGCISCLICSVPSFSCLFSLPFSTFVLVESFTSSSPLESDVTRTLLRFFGCDFSGLESRSLFCSPSTTIFFWFNCLSLRAGNVWWFSADHKKYHQ